MGKNISVSTDFLSGGGHVKVQASAPATIRFSPHDEGDGEWSNAQVSRVNAAARGGSGGLGCEGGS